MLAFLLFHYCMGPKNYKLSLVQLKANQKKKKKKIEKYIFNTIFL